MSLPDLDFGDGTAGDVTAGKLETGGEKLLRHTRSLAQAADVLSDAVFGFVVHGNDGSFRCFNDSVIPDVF